MEAAPLERAMVGNEGLLFDMPEQHGQAAQVDRRARARGRDVARQGQPPDGGVASVMADRSTG